MPALSVGFLSLLWRACPSLQGEGSQAGLCSFPFSTFLLFYLHLYPCSQVHKCNNLRIASSSTFLIWKTTRQKESWHEKHFHKAKLSCDGNSIITILEQNWVYLSPSLFPLGWFLFFVFLCYHHSPLLFCRKELDTRTEIICAYTSCRLSKTLLPLPACVCTKKLIWFGEHRTASRGGEAANHAWEVSPAESPRSNLTAAGFDSRLLLLRPSTALLPKDRLASTDTNV